MDEARGVLKKGLLALRQVRVGLATPVGDQGERIELAKALCLPFMLSLSKHERDFFSSQLAPAPGSQKP